MKLLPSLLLLLLMTACAPEKGMERKGNKEESSNRILQPAFQTIIDSAKLVGAILVFDAQSGRYYSNDFAWCEQGQLPASTFKIPNSIIALETGVVENDQTVLKWDGAERAFRSWEQDLTLKQAFHFSCVPCYQEIARKIGVERMKEHVTKFNYGAIDVDTSSIANFWLVGKSRISPFQQIDFLQRFYQSKLPIKDRTEQIMKTMMIIEDQEGYQLSGKTGWSINGEHNNGWFVGQVKRGNDVYYFATNVEPTAEFDMDRFPQIRKEVSYQALKAMKIID